jgi:hypothetical protein
MYKRITMLIGMLLLIPLQGATHSALLPEVRQVNAPYQNGPISIRNTAVFWLGHVTPEDNYADMRVGYNDTELYLNVAIFDRRAWYDMSPSAADLDKWDSVTILLDRDRSSNTTLDASAIRFDAQLSDWEDRAHYQQAYRGTNGQWQLGSLVFTTTAGIRWESDTVGGNNNNQNNRGWAMEMHLPFTSLGLSGPPPQGTLWGLAVAVHDRDVSSTPGADQIWPESMLPNQPGTWGQLRFGLPSYAAPPVVRRGLTTVRQGLSGASVVDAQAGGWTNCGQNVTDYFAAWGAINYAGYQFFNVQNQSDIADWPCFAKAYLTFPLDNVPPNKVIISATVTLRQFGNAGAGWTPGPQPSFIQVLWVDDTWSESALTWNNAPLAHENLGALQVDPLTSPGYPGVQRTWDVSVAAAAVYAAGEPLRLAFYSADSSYHSGRYFYSSDFADAAARPTLNVTWGDPVGGLHKTVWPVVAAQNDQVTYTLTWLGSGQAMTLTDALPVNVSLPGQITATAGVATVGAAQRRILWTGNISNGQLVTMSFPVTTLTAASIPIINQALLTDTFSGVSTASAIFIANATQVWLPLIRE